MPAREHSLARLLELPRIQDPEVRRGIFRQAIAELGQGDAAGGPLILAGVDPNALGRSLQMAWGDGLLEDLSFIAPAPAAVALYQIASALPLGSERRSVGRKVLTYLYNGNAETFAALASRMALSSTRPLVGAPIRARVALALASRSAADAAVDRMALAIVTRRELARDWVSGAATGSLPERRLAARLLERAAREAARRAEAGDEHPVRLFRSLLDPTTAARGEGAGLALAWESLLADRETLVWRHVAVARGLLCGVIPELPPTLQAQLAGNLSATEWRRAATSLMARVAVHREAGAVDVTRILEGPLLRRDPGVAMALVWGLGPVAEVEPEAAEELVEAIASEAPITIADALVELRSDILGFAAPAAEICANALRQNLGQHEIDDGLNALAHSILVDLEQGRDAAALPAAVRRALDAFAESGPREAFSRAREALSVASARVGELETLDVAYDSAASAEARRKAMAILRDVDSSLLETRLLNNLLLLDRPPGASATGVEAVDDLDARLARWLLDARRRSARGEDVRAQLTIHQRQLRALLHLIDGGSTDFGDDQERRLRVRGRWSLAVRTWVKYLRDRPADRLVRAVIATVARAFDALVRDGAAEPVDVLLFAAAHLRERAQLEVVAEASMQPEVEHLLHGYLEFLAAESGRVGVEQSRARLEAFKRFLEAFPIQRTMRSEAFRTTAWRLVRGLEQVTMAGSLRALLPRESAATDAGPLAAIEDAIGQLAQLAVGAERRCSEELLRPQPVLPRRHALAHAVENVVNTRSTGGLLDAVTACARAAEAALPIPLALLVTQALPRLGSLPVDRATEPPPALPARGELPDWIPARRILGGYYVIRQLGGGNVGTVFVVSRAEERHSQKAERFALKVPEYNATAARTMSESDFLKLFREEAGALLAMPEHPNIAKFVTFDAGARPKPILVMELIEGVSCERIISSASLTTDQALRVLDGVLAGLEAMHAAGISHLDVKPSNAILRDRDGLPVLVDFGLSGRKTRPGCATLCYGAPEIWETHPNAALNGLAWAADVYAFGCFAYEVLTGRTLFEGTSDVAIISAHISHDGLPPGIDRMAQTPGLQPLAMFLYQSLRYAPAQRAPIAQLRREFVKIAPLLARREWPISCD
jgi:hypothetical protein